MIPGARKFSHPWGYINTQSYNIVFHNKLAMFYKILTVVIVILITLIYLCPKLFEINGKTKQKKAVRSFLYRYPLSLSFEQKTWFLGVKKEIFRTFAPKLFNKRKA
ncbi:MAG: hypothetical protein LBI60_00955 [Bacteroidales bacterium]|jgi:hypothetical protein|nr:hypothetical protein [Bacteroidales bacterium]